MAHSEAEIRRAIKPLLTVHGELNTSEVKSLLDTVLTFDAEDNLKSSTRKGEALIMQRIGNIVAHQKELIKVYDEGFVLDKSFSPAKFSLFNPISHSAIDPEEIKAVKEKTRRFLARKIDWEKARERNNEVGDLGEEFVMTFEINRLIQILNLERTEAEQYVQHLSRLQGDGLGYDISSINQNGSPRYIEVKTTVGDSKQPFYLSENERQFFKEYQDSAFIYRVYNFNKETKEGEVVIISQADLFSSYNFEAISWQVKPI